MSRPQLRTTLTVKLSQRLTMTPALLQKIELLTLNRLELAEMLQQELAENPVLEEAAGGAELTLEPTDQDENPDGADNPFADIDVEYFFEEYLPPPARTRSEPGSLEDKPSFESFLATPVTLQDHLNWQLNLTEVTPEIHRIAHFIIGNVNSDGYACVSNDEICEQLEVSVEDVERALQTVQSFDPPGVAARDLGECLLIQLESLDLSEGLAGELLRDHLADMEVRKTPELARRVGRGIEEVEEALKVIRTLSPKPGQRYDWKEPEYVQPDVYIQKTEDGYSVAVSDDGLPRLRLSNAYRSLLRQKTTSRETKSFIRERFRSAIELLKSVDQREATIYRVCRAIIDRQTPFLDRGVLYLRPMLIKEIAEELKVHSSTISRVVANKYAHTSQGIVELRRFFSVGVEGRNGQSFSTVQVKEMIRKIIEAENVSRPLSDQKIAQGLNREGIQITRRTVAKYRDQMNIAVSRQRRATA